MLRRIRASIPLFTVIVFSFVFCIRVVPPSSAAPLAQTSEDFVEVQRLRASDGTPQNNFGIRFEVDGDTLLAVSDKGVYIFASNGTTWTQQTKLIPSDGTLLINGTLHGNTAIGFSYPHPALNIPARAYIFVRTGTTWTQQAVLTPGEPTPRSIWNISFMDSETILIGVTPHYDLQLNGAVYIYTRSGTTWSLQDTLSPSDGVYDQEFGVETPLVLDSSTILVPAVAQNSVTGHAGAVYVYTRSGTDWTEQAKLIASDSQLHDRFGYAVAEEGNTVMIGAPGAASPSMFDGAVYVFTRSGNTFMQQQKLFLTNVMSAGFGTEIALEGDSVLIGAPSENREGAVYEFIRSGNTWIQQSRIEFTGQPNPNVNTNFGEIIKRDGNFAIISVPSFRENDHLRGRVYLFEKSGGNWMQKQDLRPNDNLTDHWFGGHIELQGDILFIGAPAWPSDPARQGEIHIYERGGIPTQRELLVNGGFDGGQSNGVPAGWTRKNTTKDERRCNKANEAPIAYSGNCAYFMKGGSPTGGKLAQNVNLSQFNLKAGDIVRLNGFYNKQSTGSVYVYLYVSYANFPEDQRRIILTQPTNGYQPVNQSTITLKETPTRIRVVLENQTTSGKTWFDAMSLTATTGSQNNLLSLPLPSEQETQTESLIPLP